MSTPDSVSTMSPSRRLELALQLLNEQVIGQRDRLRYWKSITNQAAQIDTGYLAQHLVSLITGVPGEGMRGKGKDLVDDSEVKSANFLDSKDKAGNTEPRWNFGSNDEVAMEAFLHVPAIYLVSLDLSTNGRVRARVWRLDPSRHTEFATRYREWMEKLGKPKLLNPKRPYANFQLFPPHSGTDEEFARHGRGGDFTPLLIQLNSPDKSVRLFWAEESAKGKMELR